MEQPPTGRETLLVDALRQIRDFGDPGRNTNPRRDLMVQLSSEDCSEVARTALIRFEALTKGLKTFALIRKTSATSLPFMPSINGTPNQRREAGVLIIPSPLETMRSRKSSLVASCGTCTTNMSTIEHTIEPPAKVVGMMS